MHEIYGFLRLASQLANPFGENLKCSYELLGKYSISAHNALIGDTIKLKLL